MIHRQTLLRIAGRALYFGAIGWFVIPKKPTELHYDVALNDRRDASSAICTTWSYRLIADGAEDAYPWLYSSLSPAAVESPPAFATLTGIEPRAVYTMNVSHTTATLLGLVGTSMSSP